MIKTIELLAILVLLALSFLIGVKYSESVKSHADWLFESKEDEIELPDLSNETINDSDSLNNTSQTGSSETPSQDSFSEESVESADSIDAPGSSPETK